MTRGLKRTPIRLAKRSFSGNIWEGATGYVVADGKPVVAAHRVESDWQIIHVPSGFSFPALYSKTLAGIAPVVIALNAIPALDVAPSPEPGVGVDSAKAWKPDLIAALRAADTTGLNQHSLSFITEDVPAGVRAL